MRLHCSGYCGQSWEGEKDIVLLIKETKETKPTHFPYLFTQHTTAELLAVHVDPRMRTGWRYYSSAPSLTRPHERRSYSRVSFSIYLNARTEGMESVEKEEGVDGQGHPLSPPTPGQKMGIDEAAWANNYPCQPSCDPFPLPAALVYARPSGDFGSDKGQGFISGAIGASHRHPEGVERNYGSSSAGSSSSRTASRLRHGYWDFHI